MNTGLEELKIQLTQELKIQLTQELKKQSKEAEDNWGMKIQECKNKKKQNKQTNKAKQCLESQN